MAVPAKPGVRPYSLAVIADEMALGVHVKVERVLQATAFPLRSLAGKLNEPLEPASQHNPFLQNQLSDDLWAPRLALLQVNAISELAKRFEKKAAQNSSAIFPVGSSQALDPLLLSQPSAQSLGIVR